MAPPPFPGTSVAVDVFFYTIEDETVGPNCVVENPARIPHLLANESDGVCRVLAVKVPGQASGGKLL